jgi:hypothetical protein
MNYVCVVHDQASSPLRFLMASAPPAGDGAELNMVVFVRLKGWFYEVVFVVSMSKCISFRRVVSSPSNTFHLDTDITWLR